MPIIAMHRNPASLCTAPAASLSLNPQPLQYSILNLKLTEFRQGLRVGHLCRSKLSSTDPVPVFCPILAAVPLRASSSAEDATVSLVMGVTPDLAPAASHPSLAVVITAFCAA